MNRFLSILLMLCLSGLAAAQTNFPQQSLRLIVPFGQGSTDIMGRYLAERLQAHLGQTVNVVNQPGAIGTIGTRYVADSAPDGYTLTVSNTGTHAAAPSLFSNLPYDPVDSFTHIGTFGRVFWVLQVRENLPVNNLEEFVAYAKANPGKVTMPYYSASARLSNYLLTKAAGIEIYEVPYKDSSQVLTGLRQGDLDASFFLLDTAAAQEQLDFIKSLAVSSPKRAQIMPSLPTFAETFPGFEMSSWLGIAAAAGTPEPIAQRLRESLSASLKEPQTHEWFASRAIEVYALDEEATKKLIQEDMKIWAAFVKDANIPPVQ
ncbi:MAG: tripartite tricarboxylate transporter substrate binding protein [Pusillimonas sp.]